MFDPVAEASMAVKEIAAEDRGGWSPLARTQRLGDLLGLKEQIEAEVVRATAEWDQAGAWAEDGAVTPAAWLRAHHPMVAGEANSLVRTGRVYARHDRVAEALAGGEISVAHARIMARAERHHEEPFAECAEGLVAAAKRTSVRDFAAVADEWVKLVDDRPPADDALGRLHISDTFGGTTKVDGFGDADEGAVIRAAVEAIAGADRDHRDRPRTPGQRRWDAFVELCRRSLDGDPESGSSSGVEIIVDADTAAELLADPDGDTLDLDDHDDGSAEAVAGLLAPYLPNHNDGDDHSDDDGRPPSGRRCHHTDGAAASRAFAAALICTGWVRRVIRDPRSGQILDYGDKRRLFSRAQRRALVHRDGGCSFPGCTRGPLWCDAHHLRPWDEGGLTNLANAVLLCRKHHTLIHQKGWRLERDPATGIVTATGPDGRTLTRKPGQRC